MVPELELERIFRAVMNLDADRPVEGIVRGEFPAWDSLRHAELILRIQDRLGIAFRGAEIIRIDSYAKLRSLIEARMSARRGDPGDP